MASSEEQKLFMDEALLEQLRNRAAPEDREGAWPSLLTSVGFAFLTFSSAMAVYRSNGDVEAMSFAVFSYLDLVAIFYCLRLYERAMPGSARRENLKMAVWLLTTMFTFSCFALLVSWFSPNEDIDVIISTGRRPPNFVNA